MESLEVIVSAIVGAILPFVIALIKRKWELNENNTNLLVFGICILVTILVSLAMNGWDLQYLLANFAVVYTTSQIVYVGLRTKVIDRIQGPTVE